VVRTGITSPPVSTEKSYRLFIEELPQPRQDNQTAVSIVVRFGIPVFVKPLKEEKKGVIDSPRIGPTSLSTVIRNTGSVNLHLKNVIFTGRDKQGQEIFRRETQGGYLLVGTARPYSAAITPDECRSIASFEIEANNDKIPLNTTTLVDRSLCGP
jgi:fimbrial chaperone protein